jgi:hypothetical protein
MATSRDEPCIYGKAVIVTSIGNYLLIEENLRPVTGAQAPQNISAPWGVLQHPP